MRRAHMIPLLVIAAVALTAGISSEVSRKGVRAVIIHGVGVPAHIRFGDMQQATALYNSFYRVMRDAPQESDRESFRHRPCLGVAVFGMKWEYSLVEGLGPEHADFQLFYYPAVDGRPLTLFNGAIVPNQVAEEWARVGIPVTATPAMRPPCKFH
jgi:hypothetical protein